MRYAIISTIFLVAFTFVMGMLFESNIDHLSQLNTNTKNMKIENKNVTENVNFVTMNEQKYDNNTIDCDKKRNKFILDPNQATFSCNGELTIKTGNTTYRDSFGNSIIVDYGWHFTLDNTLKPIPIKIIKRCYQDYMMQHEVCNP